MIYRGRIWKFGDNISTDSIMPGAAVFAQPDPDGQGASAYALQSIRPGWARMVQPGDILIAGRNFGCGSGRPAPRVLQALGLAVVVADSISRQFFRNSIHLGFPVLICAGVSSLFAEGECAEVSLATGLVLNLATKRSLRGEPLPEGSPPQQILLAGGLDAYMLKMRVAEMKGREVACKR